MEVIAFEVEEEKSSDQEKLSKLDSLRKVFEGERVDLSKFKFDRNEANDCD